ncbi:MAG: cobalamin biosynthesis protein CobD [Lachnospiraceae bacterium]|nr:cobalamin biosynthesis protein CobD [Lachnospiraceae bacterium]
MRLYLYLHLIAFAAGCLLDLLIGDPYNIPHPIRAIGSLISALEKKLYVSPGSIAGEKRNRALAGRGTLLFMCVILLTFLFTAAVVIGAYLIHPYAGAVVEAVLTCYILAGRCLCNESMKVSRDLKAGDIDKARFDISMIVGRDTDKLDEAGIIRAAVETVAENASDGVIAPFIYTFIGGPTAGLLYKAVNTMDSMIAYRNERYEYFGKTAAAADDVLNFLPSRVCALLFCLAAVVLPFASPKEAFRIWRRDRRKHQSPNSAQSESACAGALGIRLGGECSYKGVHSMHPYLGDHKHPLDIKDIGRANMIMFNAAGILFVLLYSMTVILFCAGPS